MNVEAKTMVTITERALMARINRKLTREGSCLRKTGYNSQWYSTTGRYYVYQPHTRQMATNQDLEKLGRELGVITNGEMLEAAMTN